MCSAVRCLRALPLVDGEMAVVLEEVRPSSKPLLQPLAMLATFLSNPSRKEAVVADLDSLISGNVDGTNYVQVH